MHLRFLNIPGEMPNSVLCELTSWSFQPPGNLVAQNKDLPFLLLHVCDFFFFFLLALLPENKKIIVSSYCSLLLLLLGAVGFRVHILFYNGFYSHIREDLGSTVSMEHGCLQLEPPSRVPDSVVTTPSLQPCPRSLP